MEETKWSKPLDKTSHEEVRCASVQAATRVNAEQSPKIADAQADPGGEPEKAETPERKSKQDAWGLRRGSGGGMYTRETHATREALMRGLGRSTERPRGRVLAHQGDGEARSTEETW